MRERLKNLMPQYMKDYELKRSQLIIPDLKILNKEQYIEKWIMLFDKDAGPLLIDGLTKYSSVNLKTAFVWVHKHFAELDLGGNYSWFGCLEDILGILEKKQWNSRNKTKIIKKYIVNTRWYET